MVTRLHAVVTVHVTPGQKSVTVVRGLPAAFLI